MERKIQKTKKVKHAFEYALFRALLGPLCVLPTRLSSKALSLLIAGAGIWKLNSLAMENLDLAYGASLSKGRKKKILQDLYKNLNRMVLEFVAFRREGGNFLREILEADPSTQRFQEALDHGKGVIVVTPHFGNWELLPFWFDLNGYHGAVVRKRSNNQRLDGFLSKQQKNKNFQIIYHNEFPRRILRILSSNGVVGILPDVDTTRFEGIFVDYFGRPTYTPTSPASLSIMSGAPILPSFSPFLNGKYRFMTDELLYPKTNERSKEEIRRLTTCWSDSFERVIRKFPDQWMWFQRRWRTTPENFERKKARQRMG